MVAWPALGRRLRSAAALGSPLHEPLDLASGVHDALLARVEGMADRADLGLQLAPGGPGGEGVPADAGDDRVLVEGGVNLGFHGESPEAVILSGTAKAI